MNEIMFIKKYQIVILKDLLKRRKQIKRKIDKNNKSIVDAHLQDVGTSRYWKRSANHSALTEELETVMEDMKYLFEVCDVKNNLDQHRYKIIDNELREELGWLDE